MVTIKDVAKKAGVSTATISRVINNKGSLSGKTIAKVNKAMEDLGYSPYALSRVFSGTFHTNFNQYLNDLRLNLALNLLENSEESITELAMESGFASMRTFNRAFQERYRMSPREYRKTRGGKTEENQKNL